MARKHDAIDLMALYAKGSANGWNQVLTRCHRDHNINKLVELRYGLQAGLADLAKKKLDTEEVVVWYCRLIKSLEKTAKAIIRERHPLPGDNPLKAKDWDKKWVEIKRKRDHELQHFLHAKTY